MADTIPGCDARVLAQGLTYRLWADPEPGHVVAVHAAVTVDGRIIPDRDADDRTLVLRVAAGPGDVIEGRDGTVFVDDVKFDDIATEPFEPGHRPQRAVLPPRGQPLGRHRLPDLRARARQCDFRPGLRGLLAAGGHHVPLRPGVGPPPGRHQLHLNTSI